MDTFGTLLASLAVAIPLGKLVLGLLLGRSSAPCAPCALWRNGHRKLPYRMEEHTALTTLRSRQFRSVQAEVCGLRIDSTAIKPGSEETAQQTPSFGHLLANPSTSFVHTLTFPSPPPLLCTLRPLHPLSHLRKSLRWRLGYSHFPQSPPFSTVDLAKAWLTRFTTVR